MVTTANGPAVHVWDLRAIRRHLAGMGLDWDKPNYSEDDPADPALPPLPPLQVDLGPLARHSEHFTEAPSVLVERYTARIKKDPSDGEAYHHRGYALIQLNRTAEAIDDLTQAIRLRPDDAHLRAYRGKIYAALKNFEQAIVDLEASLAAEGDQPLVQQSLALCCNNVAWVSATGPPSSRDPQRALSLARRAHALDPIEPSFLNTLGVAEHRAGRYAEAIATLEKSLASGTGATDAYDLLFLAMARFKLSEKTRANNDFDRALSWRRDHSSLPPTAAAELDAFQAEAEAVLEGRALDLPADVFGPKVQSRP